ncbi:hypothetical protein SAICODRAFT_55322 [Saitoella complicata NRRL Y-17804]|uniref:Uncharacterized protein n=1 Tax=Saitoella complicata (strain BCRC 22490 / CBS 7301 / JCM 7358 / NBRC 10748 / NRRL Y-17804) TaxID=698492 RepID=A0A0E9NMA2_SAICN|nr:uncharacterized protein SAICODRAFT_55322 [Saitoella complicata NRRL Y-17804]ODQ53996.1 hypothetical protein SAICODRAFT_55322 [Saitoella complicata NRRL Y-17804]GAO50964.1 hypothetical protein G7K_5080-t1 [Saitoella complicata NRRL Y-17804]
MSVSSPKTSRFAFGTRSPPLHSRPSTSSQVSLTSLFAGNTSISTDPSQPLSDSRSFIAQAFVPHVAFLASSDADEIAREKGWEDLLDLVRVFGDQVQGKVGIRDSSGQASGYEDFGVRFTTLGSSRSPLQAGGPRSAAPGAQLDAIERLLERHVREYGDHLAQTQLGLSETSSISSSTAPSVTERDDGGTAVQIYPHFLRRVFSSLPVATHETFAHPVACVLAVSSRHPDPISGFTGLYTRCAQTPMPVWVDRGYLRYYLLVHDEDKDDLEESIKVFERIKRQFGLNCWMVRINSRMMYGSDDDVLPVPQSLWMPAQASLDHLDKPKDEERYLSIPDADALKAFVRHLTTEALVPFMERQIQTWDQTIVGPRRGLTGRLSSLSRRYFGSAPSTRTSSPSHTSYDPSTGSYPPTSPEAQMRKMADWAFMLRDWKLANSTYEMLRKEFSSEKAFGQQAGAQEMYAITHLMMLQPLSARTRQEILDPAVDSALYSYLTRSNSPYAALRLLLSVIELLRVRPGSSQDAAALWTIKLLSLQPPLLPPYAHALMVDRVANIYFNKNLSPSSSLPFGSRRRKAAMWAVLAAEAWLGVEEGKKVAEVARRCAKRAGRQFEGNAWDEISFHIRKLIERTSTGEQKGTSVGDELEEKMEKMAVQEAVVDGEKVEV